VNRNPLPSHLRRAGIACALAAAVVMLPLPASAGVFWNIGAGVGYAALMFALILYLFPLRGDGVPHSRLFTVSQHRRLGWIALFLAVLHAVILLIAQPLVGHYFLPSAPLYMLCGLAALIALAVLVATGISARSGLRHAAPPRAARFSVAAHAVLAVLLLGLFGAHIIGSGQLADRPVKIVTASVLLALALLRYAWRPAASRRRHRWAVFLSRTAVFALLVMPTPLGSSLLLQPVMLPPVVHVYFPHEDHRTVNCVACHHNFVDHTGAAGCLDCHRSARPDLRQSGEATFHVFCRDCHSKLALQGQKHGPVRECSVCHAG
jgi:hypothetical protein